MPLTDQQLRQELLKLGETVPPVTQRNREELRTRLDVLRARARSPVRARRTTSPTRAATRSKPVRGLIELSDSDTDFTAENNTPSRAQTRSVAVGRDTHVSPNVTVEVEESIARHRREIQQLIDSARDRTRAAHSNLSTSRYEPTPSTPLRPTSSSSRGRSTTAKPSTTVAKGPSWFDRAGSSIRSFWKANKDVIINLLKMVLIGVLLGGALIVVKKNAKNIIPHRRGILCTPENATECEDMFPVYNAVKEFLQIRAGEVECGYRGNNDRHVTRDEIGKHLDKKGLKFEKGSDARWDTLVAYILGTDDQSISVLDAKNARTGDANSARKLSAQEGIYPLACSLQKGVKSAMEHLVWLVLGTTGFLTLGWLLKRHWNKRAESEQTYQDLTEKIINMLEDQYDEHLRDPEAKPWLSINHIRDMLISSHDRHRLKALWERARKQISENESRVRVESQLIHGEEHDVWRWIQPRASSSPSSPRKKRAESPQNTHEESYVYMPPDVGLTQCLKLRNFFDPDTVADDDEIDLVVDSVQNRCATVRRIEHIGIHSIYVYLKFSSKEAASQGFHLLNNWKYHGREIIAKYLRLERYHEHFPEAIDSSTSN